MKVLRVLAYPVLLLLAHWIPKMVVARLQDGYAVFYPMYGLAVMPYFWYGWAASAIAMVLVHGYFLRRVEKYPMVWMLVAVLLALALQAVLAPHLQNVESVTFDAIAMFCVGLITVCLIPAWRAIRDDRTALGNGDSWGQWVMYALQFLLWVGAAFAVTVTMADAFGPSSFVAIFGWCVLLLMAAVSTAFHEGGHYLGARLTGMKVLLVRVMAVECYPRRGWWLVRWASKRNKRYGGLVYALPDPARPMRRPMLWMVAMGPMANAIVGALSLLLGLVATGPLENVAMAFAIVNGVMAIGNLLPRRGRVNSDGAKLIEWWRRKDDTGPELMFIRLTALSVFGTTADALPESDLKLLESRPMPLQLTAMWYRLKAAQNRADWEDALRVGDRFEEALRKWNQAMPELDTHIRHVRTEVAFSRAMATGRHDDLQESLLSKELRQLSPYLWLRCLALKAWLGGAEQEAQRLLQKGMDEAIRSVDLALPKSEAMLARYVLERGRV